GILILLWADLSWFGLLVLLALVAAVVVGAQRIADAGGEGEDEAGPVTPEPEAPPAVQPQ
ncbi:MAG TPA: hypothetical protein VFB77_10940, partial [Acidimicrobiales bacterium]|nr:hypothetical protein [Acidimicrobiales bacterium]